MTESSSKNCSGKQDGAIPAVKNFTRGFTLIEMVIAIGLAVLVGGSVFVAMDPSKQLAQARNNERKSELNTILSAIRENITDTRTGQFTCINGDIPTSTKKMAGSGVGNYDIAPCLVPTYAFNLPFDPSAAGAHYSSNSDYDTGYTVVKDPASGQITVAAPGAELGQTISITR